MKWALVALSSSMLAAANSGADTATCRAEVKTTPRLPVVGQQILYRVRIARVEDAGVGEWEQPLSFPRFRAEWLPGQPETRERGSEGVQTLVREERRALFATQAGRLEIPSATLICARSDGRTGATSISRTVVPAVQVNVASLPLRGRPADFGGLVGPIRARTLAEPVRIELGGSFQISVLVRGHGNLWEIDSPLREETFPEDVEVFPMPSRLATEAGEQLDSRRFFRASIVPHREGPLRIPPLRIPYYDPESENYRVATTEAVELLVLARGADTEPGSPGPHPPLEATQNREGMGPSDAAMPSAAIATAVLLAGGFAWRANRRRRSPWNECDREVTRAREAQADGERDLAAAALERALRAALAVSCPGLGSLEPRILATQLTVQANTARSATLLRVAEHLGSLEQRFDPAARARDPDAVGLDAIDPDAIEETIARLRSEIS